MVLAGRAALEPEPRQAACALQAGASDIIRAFVAQTGPALADAVTAYMAVVMTGLSAEARAGVNVEALLQVAQVFPAAPYPNRTAVGVRWLAGVDFEIKVIARIPCRPRPPIRSGGPISSEG